MSESVMEQLLRARPPQVKITYDVETGGAVEKREIPFVVGVFADLSGDLPDSDKPRFRQRSMLAIDRDNFDAVLKAASPRVDLSDIDKVLPGAAAGDKLSGALAFDKLEDFEPLAIVMRVGVLKSLYEARETIRQLQVRADGDAALKTALHALLMGTGNAPAGVAPELLSAFDAQVKQRLADGRLDAIELDDKDSVGALIGLAAGQIDQLLGRQLSLIMRARNFQDLEATWRGLHHLVVRSETGPMLQLRVLNASRSELFEDLYKAVEFDQSAVFKTIYEAEYGTFGGTPYGLLVGAYEFGPDAESVACLTRIAAVAAAAHAPFIAAANPGMFGLPGFDKLDKPRDLARIFEGTEFIGWNEFRNCEDSRYVGLVLPRVLLRLPYGDGGLPAEGFDFQEEVASATGGNGTPEGGRHPVRDRFLWGNAAFFLAARITNAFALHRWTAAAWGSEGGGLVDGLPQYACDAGVGGPAVLCPTETAISDRRGQELSDLGFIALSHCKGSGQAKFFGGRSTRRPRLYISDEANANARESALLPCVLAASRFAHYIKVMMREKVGSFLTRGNAENYLNSWIAQYVLPDDDASQEIEAAHPLRAARVQVTDVPGEPGAYSAQAWLQPNFQLARLDTVLRIEVRLPA